MINETRLNAAINNIVDYLIGINDSNSKDIESLHQYNMLFGAFHDKSREQVLRIVAREANTIIRYSHSKSTKYIIVSLCKIMVDIVNIHLQNILQ